MNIYMTFQDMLHKLDEHNDELLATIEELRQTIVSQEKTIDDLNDTIADLREEL